MPLPPCCILALGVQHKSSSVILTSCLIPLAPACSLLPARRPHQAVHHRAGTGPPVGEGRGGLRRALRQEPHHKYALFQRTVGTARGSCQLRSSMCYLPAGCCVAVRSSIAGMLSFRAPRVANPHICLHCFTFSYHRCSYRYLLLQQQVQEGRPPHGGVRPGCGRRVHPARRLPQDRHRQHWLYHVQ